MTTLRWPTLVLAALLATPARAAVPTPTITGPITSPGGAFITPPSGLGQHGRHDVPGQAVRVLNPAALLGLLVPAR